MEIIKRTQAAEGTSGQYLGVPFEWGRADCARMAANHIRRMGHKVSLLKGGSYKTALGAQKALIRAGHPTLEAALDDRFARIAPAEAWVGDLIALKGDAMWPALTVNLSNGRVLGFQDGACHYLQPSEFLTAWRVPCLR